MYLKHATACRAMKRLITFLVLCPVLLAAQSQMGELRLKLRRTMAASV